MEKRKKLVIAIIIGFLAIVVLMVIFGLSDNGKPRPTESEGPGTVVIDNTLELSNLLLKSQYGAINEELVSYIQSHVDKKIEHATIKGNPVVNHDGSISFKVETENPNKVFTVLIDRSGPQNQIIFTVPEANYSKTLKVYK